MQPVFDTIASPAYKQMTYAFSVATLFLAVAFVIVAFSFYSRSRDIYGNTLEEQRWTLLLGTWRDSLIITILFLAEAMFYRFMSFQGLSEVIPSSVLLYAPAITDVFLMCLHVAAFTVAILRIITLSRWLMAQAHG